MFRLVVALEGSPGRFVLIFDDLHRFVASCMDLFWPLARRWGRSELNRLIPGARLAHKPAEAFGYLR